MILDKQMQLSAAQAITVTAKSTETYDNGPTGWWGGSNAGHHKIEFLLTVDETFTAGGAATLTVQLRSSANSDMSSPVIHEQSRAFALADLQVGDHIGYEPLIPSDIGRYVDLNYVVATGPMTAGKISATGITGRQTNK